MSDLLAWFTPTVMRLLAWTLLHFLWQALILAAIFAGLMATFRTATTRYVLAVSTLLLMMAAPIGTFLFLRQSLNSSAVSIASFTVGTVPAAPAMQTVATQVASRQEVSPDTFLWLVRFWMAGILFFSLRTAGGMLMVERLLRRKAAPVAERLLRTCFDLQRELGIKRAVRFCQCNGLDVPAVIGWFRPVVLLPMTVLTGLSQTQLEAVIVHELTHIKRCDYLVNLLQIVAETLLFYHPALWWVSHRIRVERENCCDDAAVALRGDVVDYARALTYMEGGRIAPSLAMAAGGSPLAARVMRLLGTRRSGGRIAGAALATGVLCLTAGILLSQAFVRVAHADMKPAAGPVVTPKIEVVPKIVVRPVLKELVVTPAIRPVIHLTQITKPAIAPAQPPSPPVAPTPATQVTTSDEPSSLGSYIDSLKAVGLDHLSADELVAMKIQGVTADDVRQMHDLGLKPSPDDLIAMRIQGVTPQYIRDMRAGGITADTDELVAMKIQGVTPEYLRSLHDLGLKPDADDLVAMRVQQVTPEYMRDIRALGMSPTIDELVAMRIQGVTPAYIKALSAGGIASANPEDYIAAKVQGITPEFIEKAHQHGFQNLKLEQLIELKHIGAF